jgi:tetratricopeptide (TPR) repeat protein/CHAT domain-containing protein
MSGKPATSFHKFYFCQFVVGNGSAVTGTHDKNWFYFPACLCFNQKTTIASQELRMANRTLRRCLGLLLISSIQLGLTLPYHGREASSHELTTDTLLLVDDNASVKSPTSTQREAVEKATEVLQLIGKIKAAEAELNHWRNKNKQLRELLRLNECGMTALGKADFDQARLFFTEALRIAETRDDKRLLTNSLMGLDLVYTHTQSFSEKKKVAQRVLEIGMVSDNPSVRLTALYSLAMAEYGLKQGDKAQEVLKELLSSAQRLQNSLFIVRALRCLGDLARDRDEKDKAHQYYDQALEVAVSIESRPEEASVLESMGQCFMKESMYDKAQESLSQSRQIRKDIGDKNGQASSLTFLGNIAWATGKYESAVTFYKEALSLREMLTDGTAVLNSRLKRVLYLNLAGAYSDWGTSDDAIQNYKIALELAAKQGDFEEQIACHQRMAMEHLKRSELKLGQENVAHALELLAKQPGHIAEAEISKTRGILGNLTGNLPQALTHFCDCARMAKKENNVILEAQCNWYAGTSAFVNGDFENAESYFEKALNFTEKISKGIYQPISLLSLGLVSVNTAHFKKADERFLEAAKACRIQKQKELEVFCYLAQAAGLIMSGHYEKAKEVATSATENLHSDNFMIQGFTSVLLGRIAMETDSSDEAIQQLTNAVRLMHQTGARVLEAYCLSTLAEAYLSVGRYDEAYLHLEQARTLSRKTRNLVLEAEFLDLLGEVLRRKGDYDRAIDQYEAALRIADKVGNRWFSVQPLLHLGILYRDIGLLQKAEDCFSMADEIAGQSPAALPKSRIFLNRETLSVVSPISPEKPSVGVTEELDGNQPATYLNQWGRDILLQMFVDMGDLGKAESKITAETPALMRGLVHLYKQDYHEAEKCFRRGLDSAKTKNNLWDLFAASTGLGMVSEKIGNYQEAKTFFSEAITYCEKQRTGVRTSQRERFFNIRIRGFKRTEPYEGLIRLALVSNPNHKPGKEDEVAALETAEHLKARSFAETVGSRVKEPAFGLPREMFQRQAQLESEAAALRRLRLFKYQLGDSVTAHDLESRIQHLEQKIENLKGEMKENPNASPYYAMRYPEPIALNQTLLRKNEYALVYSVGDQGTAVFLCKGSSNEQQRAKLVKAVWVDLHRKKLEKLVRDFTIPLGRLSNQEKASSLKEDLAKLDLTTGCKLFQYLIEPVIGLIEKGQLLAIIPDGPLWALSFEALPTNSDCSLEERLSLPIVSRSPVITRGTFLGDRNLVYYQTSLTTITLMRSIKRPKLQEDNSLVVADPVLDDHDSRLNGLDKELRTAVLKARKCERDCTVVSFSRARSTGVLADTIKSALSGNVEVVTGIKATKKRLAGELASRLKSYRNLFFCTHGESGAIIREKDEGKNRARNSHQRQTRAIEPFLVLTPILAESGNSSNRCDVQRLPDRLGYFTMTDAMNLKLNAELVVLSACLTGQGEDIQGEGTLHMGRAFQTAGASSVLIALGRVNAEVTTRLIKTFVQKLSIIEKTNPDLYKVLALREAKQSVRASYDHPYFWSLFILIGEPGVAP